MIEKTTEEKQGLVIRAQTGVYYVSYDGRIIECTLRGKVKREFQAEDGTNFYKDPVAVGDKVIITTAESEKGAIEEILPRKSKLSRTAPGSYIKIKSKQTRLPKRMKSSDIAHKPVSLEQIIVANADHLLIVLSTKNPGFNAQLLDRFLVVAEAGELVPVVCVNKMDLVNEKDKNKLLEETKVYEDIGYKVIYSSALKKEGLDDLTDLLKDKLTALAGPSGAGKSTLLNAIQPNLKLRTNEVSDKTSKGKHTTTNVELHSLDMGGYVVDTPGIRELGLWNIWKEELHNFFPDISPYVTQCRFSDCSHHDEPGCAVLEAVEDGKIAKSRYKNYLKLYRSASSGEEVSEKFSDRRARRK
ncbi:ribosome small subunit-dependent GTPase A [Candidatus Poribacteria bacterium]|nr:ribosome small subunit-dependent GTPase A [Candidatus Poribacteria bacterium]